VRNTLLLVESRRRRRVARLLRKMKRLDAAPRSRPQRRRMSRASTRAVSGLVVVLVVALGAMAWDGGQFDSTSTNRWPAAPADRQDARIAKAVDDPKGADSYAFAYTQPHSDDPVTYDPCVPIHLVVNPRTIVDDGSRILAEAVDEVQDATGLVLHVDGLTKERPATDRELWTSDGSAWRPVLVAWSDPAETPRLRDRVLGVGGSAPVTKDGHRWLVTGGISLDGPELASVLRRPGGSAAVRAVVMHELGHLVGLDHVDARDELMQPEARPGLTTWGPGDRAGLAALGSGGCVDY
jgi:hypothetical protein